MTDFDENNFNDTEYLQINSNEVKEDVKIIVYLDLDDSLSNMGKESSRKEIIDNPTEN